MMWFFISVMCMLMVVPLAKYLAFLTTKVFSSKYDQWNGGKLTLGSAIVLVIIAAIPIIGLGLVGGELIFAIIFSLGWLISANAGKLSKDIW